MGGRNPASRQLMARGVRAGGSIVYCSDGTYRWVYELNLLKNPTIFVLVWKIFFFIFLGIFALILIPDAIHGRTGQLLDNLKFLAYFLIGMTAVVGLGYLVYAAIMGWKYCVMFEMDERGVNHRQMPHQAEKAKLLSELTVLAGLASGRLSVAGAGLNAARTEMYTEFQRVRKVRAYPRRNLIKVSTHLEHNQVYAEDADFEFVKSYILAHCNHLK